MPERPVYYFAPLVPQYRVPVLERLDARLGGRLVVCSGQPPAGASLRSLATHSIHAYREVPLHNYWIRGGTLHAQPYGDAFRAFGPPSALLLDESPRSITLPFLLRYSRRHDAGVALWGRFSPDYRSLDPETQWTDRYRLWLARQADACVAYTDAIAERLRAHLPEEHLFVAPNTLDTDLLFSLRDALEQEGRNEVRKRIGLPVDVPVLVFIGRLAPDKGLDELLDAYKALRRDGPAYLLVIGEGPEEAVLRDRAAREGHDGIRLLGAISAWKATAPYLFAADVLVIPGRLGLAVNHAFALGLPVVSHAETPDRRFHGPEAAYVHPGENGLLPPYGDRAALVAAIRQVLADRDRFSRNALAYAREHLTIDRMIDGLEAAVRHVEA